MLISLILLAFFNNCNAFNVIDLTSKTYDKYVAKGNIVIRYWTHSDYNSLVMTPQWEDIAREYGRACNNLTFAQLDCSREFATCRKGPVIQYPTFKYHGPDPSIVRHFTGDKTKESVSEFISDSHNLNFRASPSFFKELTPDNFSKYVMDPFQNVLVAFTAEWCGYCHNIRSAMIGAASSFTAADHVLFVHMDGAKHSSWCQKFHPEGYPTLKFFPAEYNLTTLHKFDAEYAKNAKDEEESDDDDAEDDDDFNLSSDAFFEKEKKKLMVMNFKDGMEEENADLQRGIIRRDKKKKSNAGDSPESVSSSGEKEGNEEEEEDEEEEEVFWTMENEKKYVEEERKLAVLEKFLEDKKKKETEKSKQNETSDNKTEEPRKYREVEITSEELSKLSDEYVTAKRRQLREWAKIRLMCIQQSRYDEIRRYRQSISRKAKYSSMYSSFDPSSIDNAYSVRKKGSRNIEKYVGPRTVKGFVAFMNDKVGTFRQQRAFPDELLGLENHGKEVVHDPRHVMKEIRAENERQKQEDEKEEKSWNILRLKKDKGKKKVKDDSYQDNQQDSNPVQIKAADRPYMQGREGVRVEREAGATEFNLIRVYEAISRYSQIVQGEEVIVYPKSDNEEEEVEEVEVEVDDDEDEDEEDEEEADEDNAENDEEHSDGKSGEKKKKTKKILVKKKKEPVGVPLSRGEAAGDVQRMVGLLRSERVRKEYLDVLNEVEEHMDELVRNYAEEMEEKKKRMVNRRLLREAAERARREEAENNKDANEERKEEEQEDDETVDDFTKLPPLDLTFLKEERDRLDALGKEKYLSSNQRGWIYAKRNIRNLFLRDF
ncbi:Protein disulfide-isomerase [Monocercomonoides exilis]|uniref:Protein disulfide-isomerase n=1 Tax=Monocercomonoides exilis TaxID=2049356 RepID=UPI003559DF05|nr:Protein disulfide-isomerase [Monocercomonoides exilis]